MNQAFKIIAAIAVAIGGYLFIKRPSSQANQAAQAVEHAGQPDYPGEAPAAQARPRTLG